ncbi:MAG: hypothetical protein BGO53_02775 [Sphingobacteriales bacterium 39-19]|nr:MAG: hypothetical protein BGO53_02775 [Sphingobacteriales bacterium 39-19]
MVCGIYALLFLEKTQLTIKELVFNFEIPKSSIMKKNEPNGFVLFVKSLSAALNSLFFSDDREFKRLKNFIAS